MWVCGSRPDCTSRVHINLCVRGGVAQLERVPGVGVPGQMCTYGFVLKAAGRDREAGDAEIPGVEGCLGAFGDLRYQLVLGSRRELSIRSNPGVGVPCSGPT